MKYFPYFGGDSDEICLYCCEERRGSDARQRLSTNTGLRTDLVEWWLVGTAWRKGLIVCLFTQQ